MYLLDHQILSVLPTPFLGLNYSFSLCGLSCLSTFLPWLIPIKVPSTEKLTFIPQDLMEGLAHTKRNPIIQSLNLRPSVEEGQDTSLLLLLDKPHCLELQLGRHMTFHFHFKVSPTVSSSSVRGGKEDCRRNMIALLESCKDGTVYLSPFHIASASSITSIHSRTSNLRPSRKTLSEALGCTRDLLL